MKIAVLTPYGAGLEFENVQSMHALRELAQKRADHEMFVVALPYCPNLDVARAYLATCALEDCKADILFWIDADIAFDAKDVFAVAERCAASDYAMLGVSYAVKRPHGGIVGEAIAGQSVEFFKPGLYPANVLGFGFAATKREAYVRIAEELPYVPCAIGARKVRPYFMPDFSEGRYEGEDFSFCYRLRRFGFRLGIDAEPRIFHKGFYGYGLEDVANAIPRLESFRITFEEPK